MDLEPQKDPKGGSPRTPTAGIPVREYQEFIAPMPTNGNHAAVWRVIAASGWSLLLGVLLAWFTAWTGKGISFKDLQEYEDKYSPYVQERSLLAEHNRLQDTNIGALQGVQQRNVERLNEFAAKFHDNDHDITDLQNKVKLFGDYVDGLRNPKK